MRIFEIIGEFYWLKCEIVLELSGTGPKIQNIAHCVLPNSRATCSLDAKMIGPRQSQASPVKFSSAS